MVTEKWHIVGPKDRTLSCGILATSGTGGSFRIYNKTICNTNSDCGDILPPAALPGRAGRMFCA